MEVELKSNETEIHRVYQSRQNYYDNSQYKILCLITFESPKYLNIYWRSSKFGSLKENVLHPSIRDVENFFNKKNLEISMDFITSQYEKLIIEEELKNNSNASFSKKIKL